MRRLLSLTVTLALLLPGLVALSAAPARGQEVASAGNLDALRRQYEQMLAVERNAATPPEVREINRPFLEERRAQLAAAIRNRIAALNKYRAAVALTLGDDEKRVIDGSVARLTAELRALLPEAVPASGTTARRSRRPARDNAAAPPAPVVEASFDAPANAGPAEPATPEPAAPHRAAASIEIVSPARDRVVHTSEVELEVSVNDDAIDDLMVAVYTPAAEKPKTARVFELKRSDRGLKSIVVALTKGDNRIEVSDLKRNQVAAARTLTYAPDGDVLNAPQQTANATSPSSGPPVKSLVIQKLEAAGDLAAADNTKVVICGQLQLASLNRTFALIRSTPALGDLAARFRPADADPRREGHDQDRDRDDGSGGLDFLIASQLSDDCTFNDKVHRDGLQRTAAIDLLSAVLLRLNPDLTPKPTEINRAALRDETAYLLERTSSSARVRNQARRMRGAEAASGEGGGAASAADQAADQAVAQYAQLQTNSAFSSLSADTIRKQIVLLQQYLGNVEVRLTHDGKVIDQTLTDRDGNFVFVINNPADTDNKEYVISTEGDQHFTTRAFLKNAVAGKRLRVNLDIEDRPVSLLARSLIGFDQAGAAAAKREWSYFFNFYVSKSFPFKQAINPDFGERLRLWGDFRINSVPQKTDVTSATIANFAGSGFVTGLQNLQVNQVANVFEFLGGAEFRLAGNNALLPSFSRDTKQKFTLSFIASGGFITPLDPTGTTPTIFKVFDDAPGLPPQAKGKEFVAFIPVDRDRFFRQYYAGLRVQTFFFNKHNIPLQRFPAQFDVTVGQNEFVTGGRLHGPVVRMEGFFPLPFENAKFINLFATAQMIPGRPNIATPLILQGAPEGTTVPASNILLLGVPQPNRDHYRIGVAFDAIPLIKRILQPPVPSDGANRSND